MSPLTACRACAGLISILEARRRALGADHQPCLLLAPAPIAAYLSMYHAKMAPLRGELKRPYGRCVLMCLCWFIVQ